MEENEMKLLREACQTVKQALEDKKAEDISVLDIHEISTLADFFVIATGQNPNQLKAMADVVSEKLYEKGIKLHHYEGYEGSAWILLDFGHILVHLFNKENRSFYNLDRMWSDAKPV